MARDLKWSDGTPVDKIILDKKCFHFGESNRDT